MVTFTYFYPKPRKPIDLDKLGKVIIKKLKEKGKFKGLSTGVEYVEAEFDEEISYDDEYAMMTVITTAIGYDWRNDRWF